MKLNLIRCIELLLVTVMVSGFAAAFAAETAPQSPPEQPLSSLPAPYNDPAKSAGAPPLKTLAPGVYDIGGIKVMTQEKRIEVPVMINMDKGLLEYLLVGETGKVHESLLRTKLEARIIQIALLMVGMQGTTAPLTAQGDPRTPTGDAVTLWIQWMKDGKTEKVRAEQWVIDKAQSQTMQTTNWVYTGSMISNGRFMADLDKSLVAIFHDPVALIDNPLPDGASDEVWFVNDKEVPPVGTEITLIIEKSETPKDTAK